MNFNETQSNIDVLARNCQLAPGQHTRDALVAAISQYVIAFPLFVYNMKDYDVRADFYIKFLEKFDYIIKNFDSDKCTFKTYLCTVLKNMYIDFITVRQKKTIKTGSLEEMPETPSPDSRKQNHASQKNYKKNTTDNVQEILSSVKNRLSYLVIKCYYYDFFTEEDFLLLVKTTDKTCGACMEFLDNLYGSIQEGKKRQMLLSSRINRIYEQILKLQTSGYSREFEYEKPAGSAELQNKQETMLREKQNRYLTAYMGVKEFPEQKIICDFFNLSKDQVNDIIRYFKKNVRDKYEKN